MRDSQVQSSFATATAWEALARFVDDRSASAGPVSDFGAFERELRSLVAAAEAEVVGRELERLDVDLPWIKIEGVVHRRVLRSERQYLTAGGPVNVLRTLYSSGCPGDRAVCPVEVRAPIVEGFWTPTAAEQAALLIAHVPPPVAENIFGQLGMMKPSKSSLDRLPKQLSTRWEAGRGTFEALLRAKECVPAQAVTVAISLDGIMLVMKDGERQAKRERTAARGKRIHGPVGHQEAGCASLSFYDAKGIRLHTIRVGRMPERRKATLKQILLDELDAVLQQRPDLVIVKLSDGAQDNWSYLDAIPGDVSIIDFFHATEHLKHALVTAYGETSPRYHQRFEELRHALRHDADGVMQVIRFLKGLRRRHRHPRIRTELNYFRSKRHMMRYAEWADRKLPIGSGVVEATCKSLVAQRMKCSGMRWRLHGGQGILTLRSLVLSNRFERGWRLLVGTYRRSIALPENVISLESRRRLRASG